MPVNLLQDPDFQMSAQPTQAPVNLLADADFAPGNSMPAQQSSASTGFFQNALNNLGQGGLDALSGLAKAGMGLANTPHNIVNLFSPRIAANIPTSPINAAQIDQIFGTQNPGIAGKLVQSAAQFAPFALGAEALGAAGLPGDIATGATYGATQSQNPLLGALGGGALGAIPGGVGFVAKGANFFQPQKLADQIVDSLGQGKSLEENAQSVAQDIKNGYETRKQQAADLYNQATANFGTKEIYPESPQGATLGLFNQLNGAYPQISKDLSSAFSNDLKDVHDSFLDNPTFNNAHELRKELNSNISQYFKPGIKLEPKDQNTLSALMQSKNALDQDINSFMATQPPDIANQYENANNFFANYVAPYRDNRQIFKIAQGDITNPRNLMTIFRNPEPEVRQVVSDLPDASKNGILYSMLGKTSATESPEGLVKAFDQLDQQGLSSYVPQSLKQQISSLGARIKARNAATMGIGALTGLMAAKPLGEFLPTAMLEPAAMGAGAMLGRGVGGALQKIMPSSQLNNSLGALLSKIYAPTVIPQFVGGQ